MTINVGDLMFGLRADVTKLTGDMAAAKKTVSDTMREIETITGYAKAAFVSFGGVLTYKAFEGAIFGAIEFKARLFDLSTQTGISVTALGALAKTGKLSETSLDDITSASAKLSKAMATQNEDSKGAAQAIAALGLNYNQFKSLRPEEQLQTVARAMAGFEDGTGKTAAAMLLFGKTGATLLPFLRDLADRTDLVSKQTLEAARQAKEFEVNWRTLKSAGEEWKGSIANSILPYLVQLTTAFVEAKKAQGGLFASGGTAISAASDLAQTLANTREQLEALGKTRDAMLLKSRDQPSLREQLLGDYRESDLQTVLKNIAQLEQQKQALLAIQNRQALEAGAGVTDTRAGQRPPSKPSITGLDGAEATAKARDLYGELIKRIQERIGLADLEEEKGRKLSEVEQLQAKAYADIAAGLIKLKPGEKDHLDALIARGLVQERLAKQREEDRRDNEQALEAAAQRRDAIEGEKRALDEQLEEYGLTREELQALTVARDRDTAATLRARAANLDTVGPAGQLRDVLMQTADAIDAVAAKKAKLAAKEQADANDPNAGGLRAIRDYLNEVKRAGDATYGAVSNSIHGLEDLTVTALTGGKAKDAARAWVTGIVSELTRLAIVRPMLASIFNNGGGPGSQYSGGWMSLIGQAVGLFTGSGYSFNGGVGTTNAAGISGGRAGGGPVDPMKTYLVGEKGPELLRMGNQGGSVVPNAGAASIVYSPVIHIDARADQASVAQQTQQAVQQGNRQMLELLKVRGVF